MRTLFLLCSLALAACGAGAPPDVSVAEAHEQPLINTGGLGLDGDACCAKDYRNGNGDIVRCGTRDGGWCCDDKGGCSNCHWYECVPPEPSTGKGGAIGGTVGGWGVLGP